MVFGVTSPTRSRTGIMTRTLIQPARPSPYRVTRMPARFAVAAMLTSSFPQRIDMIRRRGSSSSAWEGFRARVTITAQLLQVEARERKQGPSRSRKRRRTKPEARPEGRGRRSFPAPTGAWYRRQRMSLPSRRSPPIGEGTSPCKPLLITPFGRSIATICLRLNASVGQCDPADRSDVRSSCDVRTEQIYPSAHTIDFCAIPALIPAAR